MLRSDFTIGDGSKGSTCRDLSHAAHWASSEFWAILSGQLAEHGVAGFVDFDLRTGL